MIPFRVKSTSLVTSLFASAVFIAYRGINIDNMNHNEKAYGNAIFSAIAVMTLLLYLLSILRQLKSVKGWLVYEFNKKQVKPYYIFMSYGILHVIP